MDASSCYSSILCSRTFWALLRWEIHRLVSQRSYPSPPIFYRAIAIRFYCFAFSPPCASFMKSLSERCQFIVVAVVSDHSTHCMNFSSSLLDALVGGPDSFAFSFPPIAKKMPPAVPPRVIMASCIEHEHQYCRRTGC
jgi:hypothetical protein